MGTPEPNVIINIVDACVGAIGDDEQADVGEAPSDLCCCSCCDCCIGVGRHLIYSDRLKASIDEAKEGLDKIILEIIDKKSPIRTAVVDYKSTSLKDFLENIFKVYGEILKLW